MDRSRLSYLDNVWQSGGTGRLKQTFHDLAQRDSPEALRQINDERLSFPVLFILMPEISARHLFSGLGERNMAAIRICSRKIYKHEIGGMETDASDYDTVYKALKWMFDSGWDWVGPSDGRDAYDSVIDYVAALLIIAYDDKAVLKNTAELIFRRNRQGLFTHDLVWCFFQSLDRDALAAVSGYLLSSNEADSALANRLLSLDVTNRDDKRVKHRQYLSWLDENKPYLYLTGEHFQMTSSPKHLDADNEAKYLGKEISPRHRAPIEPLTENEIECLHRYRDATPEEQTLLTDYSHKLRARDVGMWYEWINKQTAEQVVAAKITYEVI